MPGEVSGTAPEPSGGGLVKGIIGTVVGGAILALITSHINQGDEQARLAKEAQQKQTDLAVQQKIEEDKILAQHQEFVVKRFDRHKAQAQQLSTTLAGRYYSVTFENNCDKRIYLAIRYTDLDNENVVSGWYWLEPNQPIVVADTQQSWFDYYGNDNSGREWKGDHVVTVSTRTDHPFEYLDDPALPPEWWPLTQPDRRYFKRIEILNNTPYGQYTQKLTCPLRFRSLSQLPVIPPKNPSKLEDFFRKP